MIEEANETNNDICKRTTFETNGGWKLQRVAAKALLLFCNDVSFLFTKLNIFKIPTKRLKPPSYRNTPNIIPGSLVPVSILSMLASSGSGVSRRVCSSLAARSLAPCHQQQERPRHVPLLLHTAPASRHMASLPAPGDLTFHSLATKITTDEQL